MTLILNENGKFINATNNSIDKEKRNSFGHKDKLITEDFIENGISSLDEDKEELQENLEEMSATKNFYKKKYLDNNPKNMPMQPEEYEELPKDLYMEEIVNYFTAFKISFNKLFPNNLNNEIDKINTFLINNL